MAIVNIYALNINAPNSTKQTLLTIKEQVSLTTIIAGDFNTPFSQIGQTKKST